MPCTASRVAAASGIGGGAALDGIPSNVTQTVYRRLVWLLYCVRWNGSNQRKRRCKVLQTVLAFWPYNLHGRQKGRRKRLRVADTLQGKKKSPAPSAGARQKKNPAISDRVKCFLFGRFKQRREKPEEKQDAR